MHYMYVVECADGTWYTGYTTDVLKRIAAHNAGRGAKYTKGRRPVRLIAQAAFETKHDAMSAEFRFKQLDRRRKELLVGRATDGDSFDKVLRYGLGLAGVLERPETGGGAEQWCEDGKELAMADDGLRIRKGSMEDVDVLTALEAACFPPAEAAGREQFIERLTAFPGHFWLLEKDGEVVAAINGMATDQDAIADEMFADASLHSEEGRWQAIFGVETAPAHRCKGYAALLMERVIADAREQGRRGCILTCKEALLGYYGRFGYQNCGISGSEHGGAVWYDMKIEF